MANVCGGVARDVDALNLFFAGEGIVAVLVILAGGLRASRRASADSSSRHVTVAAAD